jgi:CheY-like chemotaxis protein
VPVIGLTADVTETQQASCLAAGMSDIAIKPVKIERLSQLLAPHIVRIGPRPEQPQLAALTN